MIIGSAEVVIRAITRGIATDIKKALREARAIAKAEGASAGQEYGRGFGDGTRGTLGNGVRDGLRGASRHAVDAGEDHGLDYSAAFGDATARSLPGNINNAFGRSGGGAGRAGGDAGRRYSDAVDIEIRNRLGGGRRNPFTTLGANASQSGGTVGRAYHRGFLQGFDRDKVTGIFSKWASKLGSVIGGGASPGAKAAADALAGLIAKGYLLGPVIATAVGAIGALAGGLFTIVGAAAQAAGALAAIPVGIAAIVQGAAVALVATRGVSAALKASKSAADANTTANQKSADSSGQAAQKAQAIADAQKNLGRAYEDSADRLQEANKRIADAQEDVKRTQEDNADKLVEANQKVIEAQDEVANTQAENADKMVAANDQVMSAEQDVIASKQDVAQAQRDLSQAYLDGAEALQQLNFDTEDAALAEEEAGIRLQKARDKMFETRSDPNASALDRQEADLNFKQAELNYRKSKDRAKDLAKEQDSANKKGVAGTKEVQGAQADLDDARAKQQDAVKSLADAEKDLGKTQQENAKALADAMQGVADAQKNVKDVQKDNARALADSLDKVAEAEDNLLDVRRQNARAIADAQEALARANATQIESAAAIDKTTAAQKKADAAYAKLGKNQKAFVDQVEKSRPAWAAFKNSLGEHMFAGADKAFKNLTEGILGTKDSVSPVRTALEGTADIMGTFGKQFAGMFAKGSEGGKLLADVLNGNNKILGAFTAKTEGGKSAFESLGLVILRVFKAAQPMTQRFVEWLAKVVKGWEKATAGAKGQNRLKKFFDDAGDAAAAWGKILGNFGRGLKNMFDGSQDAREAFMTDMLNLSQRFEDLTSAAGADKKMEAWFTQTYETSREIIRVIGEIGKALGAVADNPAIETSFRTLATGLSGTLEKILTPFIDAGPQLAGLFQEVADIVTTMTSRGGMSAFLSTLTIAFHAVNDFLKLGPVQELLKFTGPILGAVAAMKLLKKAISPIFGLFEVGLAGIGKVITSFDTLAGKIRGLPPVPPMVPPTAPPAPAPGVPPVTPGAPPITTPSPLGTPPPRTPPVSGTARLAAGFKTAATWAGRLGRAIPVVGTVIGIAALAFDIFGHKSKDASDDAEHFNEVTKDVVTTLDPLTGAITEQTYAMTAQKAEGEGLLKTYEDLGINTELWTKAASGNQEAMADLDIEVNRLQTSMVRNNPIYQENADKLAALGISNQDLVDGLSGGAAGYTALHDKMVKANGTVGMGITEFDSLTASVVQMGNDIRPGMETLASSATEAQGRAKALGKTWEEGSDSAKRVTKAVGESALANVSLIASTEDVIPVLGDYGEVTDDVASSTDDFDTVVSSVTKNLDILHGRVPSYDDAMSAYGDSTDDLAEAFMTGADGALEFDKAAVNANGSINLMNKDGRELNEQLGQFQEDAVGAAKAAFDQAGGLENQAAAQAAANKVIEEANAATKKKIESLHLDDATTAALIKTMGTIPKSVVSDIVIETKKAGQDLEHFVYDAEGKIIGIKVEPGTAVAQTDLDNWEKAADGTPLYRRVDAKTKLGEDSILKWEKDAEGNIIGIEVDAKPAKAKTTVKTFTDAITGKPVKIPLDADPTAAVKKGEKLVTDAKGTPIVYTADLHTKDKNGKDIVGQYVVDSSGQKIPLNIDTTATTSFDLPYGPGTKYKSVDRWLNRAVATGGYISGPGGPTADMIPARLSNGEFVIRAASVRKYGKRVFEALNYGLMPKGKPMHFAAGGPVDPNAPKVPIEEMRKRITASSGASVITDYMNTKGSKYTYTATAAARSPDFTKATLAAALASMGSWVVPIQSGLTEIITVTKKAFDAFLEVKRKELAKSLGSNIVYNPSAGVAQWDPLIRRILAEKGLPDSVRVIIESQMARESGGNPRAINLTDINAQNGTPSKGLLQFIDPTFKSWAEPGYNTNIWDPESQIRAFLRYVPGTYGSFEYLRRIGFGAYDDGGILGHKALGLNLSGRPERILTPAQTESFDRLVNTITSTTSGTGTQLRPDGSLSSRDRQMISAIASGVAAQQNSTVPTVRVFIGDTELRGIISSEVVAHDKGSARVISLGKKP